MAVVLITGSSTGIGLATALHFARRDHTVFASLRNPDTATELKQAIVAEKLPITIIKLDVNDDLSVKNAVAEVHNQAGKIDVLVNNAGIGMSGPIEAVSIEDAQRVFDTNYFGAIRMIKAVLPAMRERQDGTIILVTSAAGRIASAGQGHYAASKHALESASESLAQEVRPFNIRVAIIEPGVVLTPIFTKGRSGENPVDKYYRAPLRRLHRFFQTQLLDPTMPDEVAEAIEFAVTTDQPRLRYLVGKDAQVLIAGRQQTTDEEIVETGRPMPDKEYYEMMKARYGVDLYRPE